MAPKDGNVLIDYSSADLGIETPEKEFKETLTVEEVIDKIVTKMNFKLGLILAFAELMAINSATNTLATAFTGQLIQLFELQVHPI